MKRAWFQRIRGGGCQTLVMGEKPMFYYLVFLPPLLFVTLFVSPNLVNLFNASAGGWGVIAEVVVVVAGCQPYPFSHSTHVAHSSPSRTLPWSVHTLTTDLVCWLLTHRIWAILVSRRHFLGLHELLKHPRTVIRVLAVVLFIHGQNRSCFLLTQGLYCWNPHAENRVCLSRAFFCWVRVFPHAQDVWVVFPM